MAPFATEVSWPAVRFYIADGKYRRQVFAMEDLGKGLILVYVPDVLAAALKQGLLGASETNGAEAKVSYGIPGGGRLDVESIHADSKDIPPSVKGMLGWGRKAVRLDIPVTATDKQLRAVEKVCELAAEAWAGLPATLTAPVARTA